MKGWIVRICLAWCGYLAYSVCKDFFLLYCLQLVTTWTLLPGYKIWCVFAVWQQVCCSDLSLLWGHYLGCALFAYITFFSLLIEVDHECSGTLSVDSMQSLVLSMLNFGRFARSLYVKFQASAAPFVFVDDPNVFCFVSYANFCGYPLFRQLSIFCHVLMKSLPPSISKYIVAHEAAHVYYVDVWFRWLLDVFGLFLFFLWVSDVSSAVVSFGLFIYCRQGFVRAQEIWADFDALTSTLLNPQNEEGAALDIELEPLCYLASFEEACLTSGGWSAAIRSLVLHHPSGWLRVAVQLFFLHFSGFSVVCSPQVFSWLDSEARRDRCHRLLQYARYVNTHCTGLLVLYVALQAPFLCMVALQRLLVSGFWLSCRFSHR